MRTKAGSLADIKRFVSMFGIEEDIALIWDAPLLPCDCGREKPQEREGNDHLEKFPDEYCIESKNKKVLFSFWFCFSWGLRKCRSCKFLFFLCCNFATEGLWCFSGNLFRSLFPFIYLHKITRCNRTNSFLWIFHLFGCIRSNFFWGCSFFSAIVKSF